MAYESAEKAVGGPVPGVLGDAALPQRRLAYLASLGERQARDNFDVPGHGERGQFTRTVGGRLRRNAAQGARVATVTFPDIGRIAPLARPLAPRVLAFNARLREAARRHGVIVADSEPHAAVTDRRLWSADRLHASPRGHALIAAAVAHALALPGSDDSWTRPLPPAAAARSGMRTVGAELRWACTFLGPWLLRRLRGRSSGDGRQAKRPALLPVAASPRPQASWGSTHGKRQLQVDDDGSST